MVISDSMGRPFRLGTVGHAIGLSGLPALRDQIGSKDLYGRRLEHTQTALADQLAATADLVLGQGDEGVGAVLVKGVPFPFVESKAKDLHRSKAKDLYA